jgi:hypothetical protein
MSTQPPQIVDLAVEIRKQRHDFLLKYYDMAVKDLDRHFTQGWQTIATAAGAVATISLGYRDYLPVPLAVAAAFIIAFWGFSNIIETDYWALRAIAFLANVEAVYFAEEDRSAFNPYIGKHPPFKLLAILKVQFLGIVCFLAVSIWFYVYNIAQRAHTLSDLRSKLGTIPSTHFISWVLPLIIFALSLAYTCRVRAARLADYLHFVSTSPGPGIARTRANLRLTDLVDLATLTPGSPPTVIPGPELQADLVRDLTRRSLQWARWSKITHVSSITILITLLVVLFVRHHLF